MKFKRLKLKSYQHLHCSMAGSYWVPCEVIEFIDETFVKIKYHDFVIDEVVETTVRRTRVEFR